MLLSIAREQAPHCNIATASGVDIQLAVQHGIKALAACSNCCTTEQTPCAPTLAWHALLSCQETPLLRGDGRATYNMREI